MTSIEVVDVNNETKTDEAPINNEVVEQNETVNKEPTPEEPTEEPTKETKDETKTKAKAKAKALPRTKKEIEVVQCENCGKSMNAKSLRFSHPKNCKGVPTNLQNSILSMIQSGNMSFAFLTLLLNILQPRRFTISFVNSALIHLFIFSYYIKGSFLSVVLFFLLASATFCVSAFWASAPASCFHLFPRPFTTSCYFFGWPTSASRSHVSYAPLTASCSFVSDFCFLLLPVVVSRMMPSVVLLPVLLIVLMVWMTSFLV